MVCRKIPLRERESQGVSPWGGCHPSGILAINDPQLYASPTLQPELKDQELVVYQSTGYSYWESAVSIQSHLQGHAVGSEGYVKMTSFAHTLFDMCLLYLSPARPTPLWLIGHCFIGCPALMVGVEKGLR
jgi:hypothetical protein